MYRLVTFGIVKNLLWKVDKTVEQLRSIGAQKLTLDYFPAFRTFGSSRGEGVNWQYRYGYLLLGDIPDPETALEIYTNRRRGCFTYWELP